MRSTAAARSTPRPLARLGDRAARRARDRRHRLEHRYPGSRAAMRSRRCRLRGDWRRPNGGREFGPKRHTYAPPCPKPSGRSPTTPKDPTPVNVPETDRTPRPRGGDAHQAPARRAGDRPRGRRQWSMPPKRTASCSRWAPTRSGERLAKALWELGELGASRALPAALALDPTNRIAARTSIGSRRFSSRPRENRPAAEGSKAPVRIFVEETRQDWLRPPPRAS